MCCQESGEREANVALFCPKAAYDEPKVRKVDQEISKFSRQQLFMNCKGLLIYEPIFLPPFF